MAELPYMQFFPGDWLADTRMMTASAKGVWIDTLAVLWNAPERGFLKRTERAWGRLWAVEPERVPQLLEELDEVAEIRRDGEMVTVASRRQIREELERERSRNSKRPVEKRDWSYREVISRRFPDLLPDTSPASPGEFPPDSRPIPGDIPETRSQKDREKENAGGGARRPTLQQAKSAAAMAGVSPSVAEEWWNVREASEWIKGTAGGGTTPVGNNWQADLKTYASRMSSGSPGRTYPARSKGGFAGIQEEIDIPS